MRCEEQNGTAEPMRSEQFLQYPLMWYWNGYGFWKYSEDKTGKSLFFEHQYHKPAAAVHNISTFQHWASRSVIDCLHGKPFPGPTKREHGNVLLLPADNTMLYRHCARYSFHRQPGNTDSIHSNTEDLPDVRFLP